MKTKIVIILTIIVVIVGAYLLYVIPFGKEVKSFDKRFIDFKSLTNSTMSTLNSTSKLEDFNKCLELFYNFPTDLEKLKIEFMKIKDSENLLRNIWVKTVINDEDIKSIHNSIIDSYNKLSQLVSTVIQKDCKRVSDSINTISSLEELTKQISFSEGNLKSLFSNLEKLKKSSDFNKIELVFDKISGDKIIIGNMANVAVNRISNLRENKYKSVKNSINTMDNLKEASQTTSDYIKWIKTSKQLVITLSNLGSDNQKNLSCERLLDSDVNEMKNLLSLYDNIIEAEKRSNEILKNSIILMDEANNRLEKMEKFASADDIRPVYDSWVNAESEVQRAKYALNPRTEGTEKTNIWNNIVAKPRATIDRILEDVSEHKNLVNNEYYKARQQESTFVGETTRTVQRGFNRLKNLAAAATQQAAQSRIGREISLSVKVLILGTKAFYDLQNPNTDLLTWGMSYENDVDQLMNETDAIMEMEGPSLTGKNTFIEGFVNQAYSKSFNK